MSGAATPAKIPLERAWLGAPPGTFANPTVLLLAAALLTLAAGTWGYAVGALPVWAVVPLHATALYVIFTPLHESMHGVAHARPGANAWIGRIAGACLTVSLPLFRAVHFEHHSHTNDPARDPDHVVARSPRWLLPLWCLAVVTEYRRHFYGRRRWRSARDRWEAVGYEVALFAAIATAWWSGYGAAVAVLWIGPALIALLVLAFAFDFLPHYPYDTREPYFATRVYGGAALNVVLLAQNQHLIHHLWTTIPWFRYRAVFRQIEGELVARGCRVGWRVSPLPTVTRQAAA